MFSLFTCRSNSSPTNKLFRPCQYYQPTKDQAKKLQKAGDLEFRRLYKEVFGDKSDSKDEDGVEKYQQELQNFVFKNGGQLRDYQAEGVSWMLSNFINKRSGILADEMGKFCMNIYAACSFDFKNVSVF